MKIDFVDPKLQQLAEDRSTRSRLPADVIRAYRKAIMLIDAAADQRDIRNVPGNRLERLKGNRAHQHSIRLNKQWRLIIEFHDEDQALATVAVIEIVDYHKG